MENNLMNGSQRGLLPIAIVGGGPVGLVCSILLSMHNIPHRVFEQYPGTSIHPKACGLNQRTVEIFRRMGIEAEVVKHRAPLETVSRTAWYTSLGATGREIYSRDAWGGEKYEEEHRRASAVQYSTLAQIRLEPILQKRALSLNPNGIQYNSRVTNVEEHEDHVSLSISLQDGAAEQVKARFVLGADGGRGLAQRLGFEWEGEKDIVDMVSAHFKADITSIHPDKRIFISWLINPRLKGSRGAGCLYHLGPYHPVRGATEEWILAAPRHPDDPLKFDQATTIQRIRRSLELPELDIDLISISQWTVNARVTKEYRTKRGRIFLIGDACHRVPPWGALGMNTGIQDADNLIWKLVLALKSQSTTEFNGLLNTYKEERKPIAVRVAQNSLSNMRNHADIMDAAVGIDQNLTADENVAIVERFFDAYTNPDHPDHTATVSGIENANNLLDQEFHAQGIEIGWFYPSVDMDCEGMNTRHDGQIKEDGTFDVTEYHPSTIPGHHVPHAWVSRGDLRVSTRDLVGMDRFTVFTRTPGIWDDLRIGRVSIDVCVVVIVGQGAGQHSEESEGDPNQHWEDREGTWARLCGVEEDGAVLVRPDGIVAWRARSFDPQALDSFPALLDRILRVGI